MGDCHFSRHGSWEGVEATGISADHRRHYHRCCPGFHVQPSPPGRTSASATPSAVSPVLLTFSAHIAVKNTPTARTTHPTLFSSQPRGPPTAEHSAILPSDAPNASGPVCGIDTGEADGIDDPVGGDTEVVDKGGTEAAEIAEAALGWSGWGLGRKGTFGVRSFV